MRRARVLMHGRPAAVLTEIKRDRKYILQYDDRYAGPPVSLALPVREQPYEFSEFPSFFDGLLLEGIQLEAMLRQAKLDADDFLGQLILLGADLVGAVTVVDLDEEAEQ